MKRYFVVVIILLVLIVGVLIVSKILEKKSSSGITVYQESGDVTGRTVVYENIKGSSYNGEGKFEYTGNKYPWRVNGLIDKTEKIDGSNDIYVYVKSSKGSDLGKWRIRLGSGTKYETRFYLENLSVKKDGAPEIVGLGTFTGEKVKNNLENIFRNGSFVAMNTANEGVGEERIGLIDNAGFYYISQVVVRRNVNKL